MKLEQIETVAVIGLGRMGHGIAQTFAVAGYNVRGFDNCAEARATVHARIRSNLADFVANGMLDADKVEPTLQRITVADSEADAVAGSQFVVEAIAEDLEVKRDYFERIEDCVTDDTILASNSSTFTVSLFGENMRNTERAVVTHWFNPPHIVPTVEIVPGPRTTEEVIETSVALHRKIGKLAIRINGEIPGFLVNRVQNAMIREVWDLYERGIASAEDIDTAIRGSIGFRLALFGPLKICDFGGIDIWTTVYNKLAPDLRADAEVPAIMKAHVEAGDAGMCAGRGIHKYESIETVTAERDELMLKLAKLLQQSSKES